MSDQVYGTAPRSLFGGVGLQVGALLAVAIAFGGGGAGAAIYNLPVQLFALLVLALNPQAVAALGERRHRMLLILVASTMALPLLQLVPLPAALWQALPGRQMALRALDLVGEGQHANPFSLDRNRTLLAFIGLIPPFAVLVLTLRLDRQDRSRALLVIVAMGLVNVVLGGFQLATAQNVFSWYPGAVPNHLYGTFANHNAAGLFLVLSLCALLALPDERIGRRNAAIVRTVVGAILVLATVLTQSRSSIALLLLPLGFAAWRALSSRQVLGLTKRKMVAAAAAVVLLAAGAGAMLATNAKIGQTLDRFQLEEDIRPKVWSDTLESIGRYWPLGSGMSTFDEVFQVDESLEYINAKRAGRAHNEYLEIALEAGIVGLALVAAWIAFCGMRWWSGRKRFKKREIDLAALGLSCLTLQAVVDYPFRNEALLCVAAFLLGVLVTQRGREQEGSV